MRNKVKIIVPMLILTVLFTCIYFSKNNNSNNSYTKVKPEDKILYSDNLMASSIPASLEVGYHFSDVVVKGEIVDIYQNDVDFLVPVGNKLGENVPKLTCTYYSVKVEDTYLGKVDNDIITYREVGDFDEYCTKPKEKSEVILMLNERKDKADPNKKIYVSTMQEHSIITIDNNGKMYSYSNTKELSMFDGEKPQEFEKAFDKVKKQNNNIQDKTKLDPYYDLN